MDNRFEVTVSAGTMRSDSSAAVRFPHRWTPGGVTVEASADKLAHLLEVDQVAESPQAIRAGASVRRASSC